MIKLAIAMCVCIVDVQITNDQIQSYSVHVSTQYNMLLNFGYLEEETIIFQILT